MLTSEKTVLSIGAHPDDAVVGGDDQAMAGVESLLGQQVPCAREQRLRQVLALGERHLDHGQDLPVPAVRCGARFVGGSGKSFRP